ncbi:hypothetical protein GUJ93_ZPchr0005g15635 [Zizania palustris]|uniref:Uncharacterized protein n=1 Tax=Zizania palustris TaxID=103762 RepID=A0A8J5ST98_ZIZPA|nr:hypothetical protein GUJ93_ZPchr0005g15635 [Zizania palustris]
MLFLRVLQMCMWRHPQNTPLPYKGYRDEDWEDNDGALNTISMTHPRIPIEHPTVLYWMILTAILCNLGYGITRLLKLITFFSL